MKKVLFLLSVFLFICSFNHCEIGMLLEYDDIINFKVQNLNKNNENLLKISGLCGHSNYVVKDMVLNTENDSLIVNIKISILKKKKESGSFEYEILIPKNINKVLIGKQKKEIWHRDMI